ncbi:MAG: hypothetical protein Q4A78_11745 [Peptostreptococcaceae bacterium]|nr:hypothetical protein [Peptostreptococcaceae bacterium]
MLILSNIKLSLDEELSALRAKIASKLKIAPGDFEYRILRESIDARKKGQIHFVYQLAVKTAQEGRILKKNRDQEISRQEERTPPPLKRGNFPLKGRPIVVGSGPAGLFAAHFLAVQGYRPLLIERGKPVEERRRDVEEFWRNGKLDPSSNVQFGEGGAGTFSDGKLTNRSKDIRVGAVLELFHRHGAPGEITYSHKPHIGTDILSGAVVSIRQEILRLGGEVRFSALLEKIEEQDGKLCAVHVNGERIETSALILAIGHSSRDTYQMLHDFGVEMKGKPFAVGFRIEHPQKLINKAQYKEFAEHSRLGAADYHLTYQNREKNRSAYTFCMCPGGLVIASSSSERELVVNGMSYHARDMENANSALLVGVDGRDFGALPMEAVAFQQRIEKAAFRLGGEDYRAPVQRVEDFLRGRESLSLGGVRASYRPGVRMTDLSRLYARELTETLREAILSMDKRLHGFALPDALLTGVETRSSAPLRIPRNPQTGESESLEGLYPAGEGAGYAGGIVSSAVDGIKAAENLICKYAPPSDIPME